MASIRGRSVKMADVKTPLTHDEQQLKNAQDFQQKIIDAERTPNSLAAQKLAFAKQRLAKVQSQQQAFNVANPDYLADKAAATAAAQPMSRGKKVAIGAGVVAALGVGFFAWRKFRK
jgi:hypothetical protein